MRLVAGLKVHVCVCSVGVQPMAVGLMLVNADEQEEYVSHMHFCLCDFLRVSGLILWLVVQHIRKFLVTTELHSSDTLVLAKDQFGCKEAITVS